MSFLQRVQRGVFAPVRRRADQGLFFPDVNTGNTWGWLPQWFPTSSGVRMSPEFGQTISALWQGLRLLGDGIGAMPCFMYNATGTDGANRERVRKDPLAYRLRWQPNQFQTAHDFWSQVAINTAYRGLFIAQLVPGPETGYADQIVPIHPDRVTPKRLPSGRVVYQVWQPDAAPAMLTQDEVFVVRGRTEPDGITPMSLTRYGAQSLGIAIAADHFAGQFFKSGASSAMAIIDKDELGPEGIQNLHTSVMSYVGGLKHAWGVLPLENDVKIEKFGFSPNEAQLLTSRMFTIEEVARWLNIPLHMLRYSQNGTSSYASLEVFSGEFVTYTLRPIAVAIEQAVQRDLIHPDRKDDQFIEFNMDALFRGDMKSRYDAYRSGIMSGFLKRNEARIKENLNADDAELDKYWEPLNVSTAGDGTDSSTNNQNNKNGAGGRSGAAVQAFASARSALRFVSLAQGAAARVVRREKASIESLARTHAKDPDGWKAGVASFYDKHADFVAEALQISRGSARAYAAEQRDALRDGVGVMESWDYTAVETLAVLAMGEAA